MRGVVLTIFLMMITAGVASAGFLEQIQLAQDPAFLKRVEYAIVLTAVNVRAEDRTIQQCPASTGLTAAQCHTLRSAWTGQMLMNPEWSARLIAPAFVSQAPVAGTAVCTSTGCTTSATDAQLQTISDSLVNTYSVP